MSIEQIAEEKYPATFHSRGVYLDNGNFKIQREAFIAGAKSGAVEFAEWCRRNYNTFDSSCYEHTKRADSWYIPNSEFRYTTEQLYNLYLKSK